MKKHIFRNRKARYASVTVILTVLVITVTVLVNATFGTLAKRFEWYTPMLPTPNYDVSENCYALLEDAFSTLSNEGYATKTEIIFCNHEEGLAEDQAMLDAFASGEDIHTSTAANVFGVAFDAVTPDLRKRAKAVNFGILYGMGAFSLSEDLHTTLSKAKEYIASYFAAYPQIDSYLKETIKEAYQNGYVTTLFGRRRYIPELKMQNKNMQHFGERVAMNSPIQGTAADIIKIAMIRVDEKLKQSGLDARLVLQVHDELIVECHKDTVKQAKAILVSEMENAVSLAVKLKVEAAVGENWYDTH